MRDFLRDPMWQFISVIAAIYIFVVGSLLVFPPSRNFLFDTSKGNIVFAFLLVFPLLLILLLMFKQGNAWLRSTIESARLRVSRFIRSSISYIGHYWLPAVAFGLFFVTLIFLRDHLLSPYTIPLILINLYLVILAFALTPEDWQRPGQTWSYDFYEHYYASAIPHNMREHEWHKPARCRGIIRRALWAHPPKEGDGYYLYKVPIPKTVQRAKLSFSIGIRDGADMKPASNVVQFKIYVDGVPVFDEQFHSFYWQPHFFYVDVIPGHESEVKFVTNAMGEDRCNWALWGEPILME